MATRVLKVRFIKSYDYKVGFSTGVHGGLSSNGLINMNFFVDRSVIPDSETVEIDEIGRKIRDIEKIKDGDAVREVQFGTLLDINSAKRVVKWLEERIKEYEDRIKTK